MSKENISFKKIMSSSMKVRTHFSMNINDNVSIQRLSYKKFVSVSLQFLETLRSVINLVVGSN